jgi:hypothetical protein
MKQWICSDGAVFNVTDELFEVLTAATIYNKELAEKLANEIDQEIIEALKEVDNDRKRTD